MNFDFSDDQDLLRDALRKFLVKESPLAQARHAIEHGTSHAAAVWRGLADLGVTGLMLPESCGGAGLGALELCVAAEEIGRQSSPVPMASTLYLAAQALLLGAGEAQQRRWLARIAQGDIAAFAAPLDEIETTMPMDLPRFDGAVLHGLVPLVADGEAAHFAVVLAQDTEARPVLVVAGFEGRTVQRRRLETLDPSKPYVELRFDAAAAEPLDACDDALALLARVRDRAAILLAFEQLGGADAALEMAGAYARERHAFGRAIGSYQGIKHKLADCYSANQLARAHCYYGAWALATDARSEGGPAVPELAIAAAAARVAATQSFSFAAQENIQTHGGIGVTWEADCHLFYRRARQSAVQLGSVHAWRERLAAQLEARLSSKPVDGIPAAPRRAAYEVAMDFDDSPADAAFRAGCRAWLDANAPRKSMRQNEPLDAEQPHEQRMRAARDWQRRKAQGGYGAITWPHALGGRGGTAVQELIWRQEESAFDVPTGYFNVSLGMVLPSLLAHAGPEVLAAHVAPALRGEQLWCQLLSEPGAGSDLGMVRTRAVRCDDGRDGWLLNGQKVWTTLAQFADFGLVLARTDPQLPKFDGLTTFFIDMKSPGVTIRPIRQASGEAEFNEVFFDDVFVPDAQRVGALGAGWKVTLTGLMSERLAIGGVLPADLWRTTAQLMQAARLHGASALRDGRMRERLAELYLNAHGLWLLQCRGLTALGKGKAPGPELSAAKIVAARTLQDFAYLAIDLRGARGVLAAAEIGDAHARLVERLWFGAAGMRIAGGTDEVVRNNIGERVLGLPPEPRPDKGLSFNQLLAR